MNYHGAGILDAVALAAVKRDILGITTDARVALSVTISTPTSAPVMDYATGTATPTVDDDTVTALLGPLDAQEVRDDEGQRVLIRRAAYVDASLLSTPPTTDTTLTLGSDRYGVTLVVQDMITGHYVLSLERSV
jgi:hypothetical protein